MSKSSDIKTRSRGKIVWFMAIPFAASIISMIHIVTLFGLGNSAWMAVTLAITFEIAALASLVSFTVMDVVKKGRYSIYFIFGVLFVMQLIGNIYYSFDYVTIKLLEDANWVVTFKEFLDTVLSLFTDELPSPSYTKLIISSLIGGPIPFLSISFIHYLVRYMDETSKLGEDVKVEEPKNENEKPEEKPQQEKPVEDSRSGKGVIVDH